MPEAKTLERAHRDEEAGKAPSTQAGEFVREEIEHVREGKHGARSTKQAIAIGLSKARRAGVKLAPPKQGTQPAAVRDRAAGDLRKGARPRKAPSRARSRATEKALKREGHQAASRSSLARQARVSAGKRGATARKAAGRKAAATRKRTQARRRIRLRRAGPGAARAR